MAMNYRRLKKMLNPYFSFNFKTPRKGKDFTPAQKSLLTRRYKKIRELLKNRDDNTFIKFKPGVKYRSVDGLRTNKGIFLPVRNARIVRNKSGKYIVVSVVGELIREEYYFPYKVLMNPDLIKPWVDALIKKRKPYATVWLRYGTSAGQAYAPELFEKYFSDDYDDDDRFSKFLNSPSSQHGTKLGSIVGVALLLERLKYIPVSRG